jgi:hypothetical protein
MSNLGLQVTVADLNEHSDPLLTVLAFVTGLVAFLPLSVVTGLIEALTLVYTFFPAWFIFASLFALLIHLRPKITHQSDHLGA